MCVDYFVGVCVCTSIKNISSELNVTDLEGGRKHTLLLLCPCFAHGDLHVGGARTAAQIDNVWFR